MLRSVVKSVSDFCGIPANDDDEGEILLRMESRQAPRHEVAISAVLELASVEYPCTIRSLSPSGMMIEAEQVSLCVGQQIVVTSAGCEPLIGIVRWFRGRSFGAQFPTPIPLDLVHRASNVVPKGMRARSGRARVRLPAIARFGVVSRNIEVLNVSVGGLMLKSNLPFASAQGLMIEFSDMLPLGGHVRWGMNGMNGLMFIKLLPLAAAEEIARRAHLGEGWMDEVRAAHRRAGAA